MKKIAIIGGGIIGLSMGYKLSLKNKYEISVYEKENDIAKHQSGRNSGVLHSGLYYKNGSLKAKLAVDGIKQMSEFCHSNNINYEICGKIVTATNSREEQTLKFLFENGKKNGLKGLSLLSKNELRKREPYVNSSQSLLVPEEGIVDYKMVCEKLKSYIENSRGKVNLGFTVKRIESNKKNLLITDKGNFEHDFVINCSGLYSDRIYNNSSKKKSVKIIPFRGEYLKFKDEYSNIVNHLIYPVPDIKYPFLGVHFTRTIDGSREVGPNAVLAFHREGYSNSKISLYDLYDTFSYSGLYKFLFKNFKFSIGQLYSSMNMSIFIKEAQKLIPDVNENMFVKGNAGVRAQAMNSGGDLVMDFNIMAVNNQVHVLNAPSPGATSSLSIADFIIDKYFKD